MSSFFVRILQLGYFLLAAMVQFSKFALLEEVGVSTQVDTHPRLIHLKLWSWVSLSFGTISPRLLIFHCGWMFNGAMLMLGSHVILLRGRGRVYPWMTLPVTNFKKAPVGTRHPYGFQSSRLCRGWQTCHRWRWVPLAIGSQIQLNSSSEARVDGFREGGEEYLLS
jgi:hypothetical protein